MEHLPRITALYNIMQPQTTDTFKSLLDITSLATVVATLIQVLPAIAALFTIVWTGLRIWKDVDVQRFRLYIKSKFQKKDK